MKHLTDINETYLEHFKNAIHMTLLLQTAVFVLIIHAICPQLFVKTGGNILEKGMTIKNRGKQSPGDTDAE